MDYEVLYSINYTNMPAFTYITLTITIIVVIVFIKLFTTKSKVLLNSGVRMFFICYLIFSIPGNILGLYSHLSNAYSLKTYDYKVVEGQVENFCPASANPKGHESFEVNGKKFEYSSTFIRGGLSHSVAENKNMKNGSIVKVFYRYDAILRLEVKK